MRAKNEFKFLEEAYTQVHTEDTSIEDLIGVEVIWGIPWEKFHGVIKDIDVEKGSAWVIRDDGNEVAVDIEDFDSIGGRQFLGSTGHPDEDEEQLLEFWGTLAGGAVRGALRAGKWGVKLFKKAPKPKPKVLKSASKLNAPLSPTNFPKLVPQSPLFKAAQQAGKSGGKNMMRKAGHAGKTVAAFRLADMLTPDSLGDASLPDDYTLGSAQNTVVPPTKSILPKSVLFSDEEGSADDDPYGTLDAMVRDFEQELDIQGDGIDTNVNELKDYIDIIKGLEVSEVQKKSALKYLSELEGPRGRVGLEDVDYNFVFGIE